MWKVLISLALVPCVITTTCPQTVHMCQVTGVPTNCSCGLNSVAFVDVTQAYATVHASTFGSWVTQGGNSQTWGPGCIYYDEYCQPIPNQTPCGGGGTCGPWTASGSTCTCNTGYVNQNGTCIVPCTPWPAAGQSITNTAAFLSSLPSGVSGTTAAAQTVSNGVLTVCASTQSLALLKPDCALPKSFMFTYQWKANSTAGFDTYFVFGNVNGDDQSGIPDPVIIGCDGGHDGSGFCTPVISTPPQGQGSVTPFYSGSSVALEAETTYAVTLTLTHTGSSSFSVSWVLRNPSTQTVLASIPSSGSGTQTMPYSLQYYHNAGMLLGRSGKTCATDMTFNTLVA